MFCDVDVKSVCTGSLRIERQLAPAVCSATSLDHGLEDEGSGFCRLHLRDPDLRIGVEVEIA